jgi:hypothetical protein
MRIQESIKVEIEHALGHAIPNAHDPGFPAFYSQLETEHPELAAKLVGSIVDDPPEEALFPEQLLQAKTRNQARTLMRSMFYRQDAYTGEWHLSKGKVGVGALTGALLLIAPFLFISPGSTTASSPQPAPVAATAPQKPDPAPVIQAPPKPKPATAPKPAPTVAAAPIQAPPIAEPYPAPAAAPQYIPPASAPRYSDYTPPAAPRVAKAPPKPAGTVYKNERPTGGITLYRRNDPQTTVRGAQLAAASQQAARSSGLTILERSNAGQAGNSGLTTSNTQYETAAAISQRVPQGNEQTLSASVAQPGTAEGFAAGRTGNTNEGGTLFKRGQTPAQSATQADGSERLTEETLSPGMIIPASLATGIAIAEGGQPVPVVVRTDTGLTFMGTATLNAARRMQIEFTEVVMAGRSNSVSAQAFAPDGLPGLIVDVKDVAPSLVPDLLRASASGVSNYVKSLSEATSTTIVPFGGVTSSRSSVPLGSSIAGAVADLFSVPPTQKAIVRIAQVDRGTPLLVTVIVGSQAAKPQ